MSCQDYRQYIINHMYTVIRIYIYYIQYVVPQNPWIRQEMAVSGWIEVFNVAGCS